MTESGIHSILCHMLSKNNQAKYISAMQEEEYIMSSVAIELGRYGKQIGYQETAAVKKEKSSLFRQLLAGVKDWSQDPVFWAVYDAQRSLDVKQLNSVYDRLH